MVPAARHLLRARDLIDARYCERLDVKDLARAASPSPAHFSRSFAKAFGTPRRLNESERSAKPDHAELILSVPGPPFMDESTAERLTELVASGGLSGGILATEDCRADFETLRARGVEFHQEPMERDYGIDAAFRDPSGNSWRMTQRA